MPTLDYPLLARKEAALLEEAFADLNDRIFAGSLPDLPLAIREQPRAWGVCVGRLDPLTGDPLVEEIALCSRLFNPCLEPDLVRRAVRIVLGHEMVHAWQWLIDGAARIERDCLPRVGHGASFRAWVPRFAAHGLPLSTGYRPEDLLPGQAVFPETLAFAIASSDQEPESAAKKGNSLPGKSEQHRQPPFPERL